MNTNYLKRELVKAGMETGMGKQAKGAMGKIRQYAKVLGEKSYADFVSELDDTVNSSREWNDTERDLFRKAALEAFKNKLEKELR